MEAYIKSQPLGRTGHVRDIADATVYLFADTGSYVTGQTLVGEFSDINRILPRVNTNRKQLMAQTGACQQAVLLVETFLTPTSCFPELRCPM